VKWTYTVSDFHMKQILIQSVPLGYTVVDALDENDGTYPFSYPAIHYD